MERYDLVILGATFLALGAAKAYGGKSLIIEEKTKPGFEFIDCFHNGDGYTQALKTDEGRRFRSFLEQYGLCERLYIPEWTPYVSKWICENDIPVLLFTKVLGVQREAGMYKLSVYNTGGRQALYANKILDTRTKAFSQKTLNAIVFGEHAESFSEDLSVLPCGGQTSIAEIKVPGDADYPSARAKVFSLWENRPEKYSNLVISAVADEFYKKPDRAYGKNTPHYKEVYSAYYANPFLAFDKGCEIGGDAQ